MNIYLSGPITNVLDYKEKFAKAESIVRRKFPQAKIINPTKVILPNNSEHKDYMKIDFMLLDLADVICMLSGWDMSKGACMEYGYATAKGLMILELGDLVG